MAKVRVLPEVLAHKIAAGEIVERPASVAKELIENALDAQARSITVEGAEGGRKLIRVRDDGIGMSRRDAELAFHRHATSKITQVEDLTSIATLGFRGEALPSMASVSRLRLKTVEGAVAESSAPLGTEIEFQGGRRVAVKEIAWPAGTEVTVEDLFFNVPARRKFLRTTSTEFSHLSRQVTHYALAYPSVAFNFRHQERVVFEAPAVNELRERVHQILGGTFLKNLVPLDYQHSGVRVLGFTSLPHEQRASTGSQYLFVNRRMVRDRVLSHAIRLAYRDLIPAAANPVILLFVELDPRLVDVNVHPAKTEIRFVHSDSVHRAVYHAIEHALLQQKTSFGSLARDIPGERLERAEDWAVREGNRWPVGRPDRFYPPSFSLLSPGRQAPWTRSQGDFPGGTASAVALALDQPPQLRAREEGLRAHGEQVPETAHLSAVPVVLGQFVESFLVAVDRDGVMLVDQHVAHERILFEKALQSLQAGTSCPVQRLLIPLTLELSPGQSTLMETLLREINANGFEVEWFGKRTVVIKGVPQLARDCDYERLLKDILQELEEESEVDSDPGSRLRRLREQIAISLSCRAAIKINTVLSREKMQWLMDELMRCKNPYTCPHGRPIILRMGIEEVLRRFKRI